MARLVDVDQDLGVALASDEPDRQPAARTGRLSVAAPRERIVEHQEFEPALSLNTQRFALLAVGM